LIILVVVSNVANFGLRETKVKGKVKVVPVLFFLTEHHAMKAYWGSEGVAPLVL
jgi:hypothetical protein